LKSLPVILPVTYTLAFPVKNIFSTNTLYGITTKSIILLTKDNNIFYVPTNLLNARRSTKNLDPDKIEVRRIKYEDPFLPPYEAVIPFIPEKVLNHKLELSQIEEVVVHASKYESTCYVTCIGNDFYYLEYSPDKGFDRLSCSQSSMILIGFITVALFLIMILKGKAKNQEKVDQFLLN